jgi:DNA primase
MSLPPAFLEEIRARISLADLIGRRMRLIKRGREFTGLCPFHNEKSPSFTVNEEKGFFHCFGCGAHGDVIGFVMQSQNLGFIEAVEALAGEAGLEVPKPTPEARERASRDKTLHEASEAAAAFFQAQLQARAGAGARAYLDRRGLDDAAIERFRLGYAPHGHGLLKQHLLRDFPEPLLHEAGLIGQRDGQDDSFDYFRDRVMFPILDRAGRVVAFGGRVMGDAKPKYLNSPDTPIFHKGSMLYGLNWARAATGKGAKLVVTEGYMDVIAMHRAGFDGAVAPLGTALTEQQLAEIWRLSADPIMCFDGDSAGQRAADRAAARALPLLQAGRTVHFAFLPSGEDPDSLIARLGRDAMSNLLNQAQPLVQLIWGGEIRRAEEEGRPLRTPEQRAELEIWCERISSAIPDRKVRDEYRNFLKGKIREFVRAAKDRAWQARRASAKWGKHGAGQAAAHSGIEIPPPPDPLTLHRRRQELLVGLVLYQPDLLDDVLEEFAEINFTAMDLDKLRREIINVHARDPGLDAATLTHHLTTHGFGRDVATLSPRHSAHATFALSADRDKLLEGWRQAHRYLCDHLTPGAEVEAAVGRFTRDGDQTQILTLPELAEQRRSEEADPDGPVG